MDISELAPELQELAHQRQRDQGNDGLFDGSLDNDEYTNNFAWVNTPEGVDFWERINDGEDVTDHEYYPKKINNLFPIY